MRTFSRILRAVVVILAVVVCAVYALSIIATGTFINDVTDLVDYPLETLDSAIGTINGYVSDALNETDALERLFANQSANADLQDAIATVTDVTNDIKTREVDIRGEVANYTADANAWADKVTVWVMLARVFGTLAAPIFVLIGALLALCAVRGVGPCVTAGLLVASLAAVWLLVSVAVLIVGPLAAASDVLGDFIDTTPQESMSPLVNLCSLMAKAKDSVTDIQNGSALAGPLCDAVSTSICARGGVTCGGYPLDKASCEASGTNVFAALPSNLTVTVTGQTATLQQCAANAPPCGAVGNDTLSQGAADVISATRIFQNITNLIDRATNGRASPPGIVSCEYMQSILRPLSDHVDSLRSSATFNLVTTVLLAVFAFIAAIGIALGSAYFGVDAVPRGAFDKFLPEDTI